MPTGNKTSMMQSPKNISKYCRIPRILISAVGGGSGKTFITTGIIAAMKAIGLKVAPFKKGPDYIDSKWLSLASDRRCYNLDLYLFENHVMESFLENSADSNISIIEGNHGLFDSIDEEGRGSSAFLARYLSVPVLLVVNCSKLSRSVAAIINGFCSFEKDTNIAGVILNNVSGTRHEEKLRASISRHCTIPVLGVVFKTNDVELEQRHIGIITTEDKNHARATVEGLRTICETSIDLDQILKIAQTAPDLPQFEARKEALHKSDLKLTIAMAKDAAFNFYYPDNLQALKSAGAEIIEFSPLSDKTLPHCDAIYIGGGYPEYYAAELEKNRGLVNELKNAIETGIPVYAECGGLMYLSEKITWGEDSHAMVGVLPGETVMEKSPQGRGYVELESLEISDDHNDWRIPSGVSLRAHEFHYSHMVNISGNPSFAFRMKRGAGIFQKKDGIIYKNLLALYSHLHALSVPWWGPCFVEAAMRFKTRKESPST